MTAKGYIAVLPAILKRDAETAACRIYITDALKNISENTARYSGGEYITKRYFNVINPPKEEKRTADEIVEHMKKKLGEVSG